MDTELAGRVVLITGAATGIGRATAQAFASEGAELALADLDGDELERTAQLVRQRATVHTVVADLSSAAGVDEAFDSLLAVTGGRLDILFNNVGTGAVRSFDDLSDEDWIATLNVNFMSQVRAIRRALAVMRAQGSGVITNNASDLARQPEAVPIDYGVSKAAVLSLTKALARSEGPAIRINAVAPGPIWTEFWTKPGGFAETMGRFYDLPPKEAVEHEMRKRELPLARLGTPEEVADVVVFLSSARAAFVTGSVWGVDGGSIRNIL
ncbi:MAG: SDR family oxidoreductase [Actinomycetales bacterium]|nr:SDR family oxidoreductase [Actinomycetales bacterium]